MLKVRQGFTTLFEEGNKKKNRKKTTKITNKVNKSNRNQNLHLPWH